MKPETTTPESSSSNEFYMSDRDFEQISRLASEHTGIVLGPHKRNMVYGRIARRIRSLGLSSFSAYLAYLEQHSREEMSNFINAITTNLTSLFREPHHFHYLQDQLLPELRQLNAGTKKLRIWSAGCSIGQEAYSIAMTIKRAGFPSDWDIKILATDLDSNVLETGHQGIYPADHAAQLDAALRKQFFLLSADKKSVQVVPELRKMVSFKRLNLLEKWPMKGPFDLIFCRNVVIYFNKDTQRVLFDRFANHLRVDGRLFIGHSENLAGVSDRFKPLGQTIYRKVN
ncbi:CheR family methyltransferase [Oceanobacter mangrovi]|uniref:CheR family methyltransferase n=1 Tax=Oceanobacter mangrovi TaxID=2862510 RepID=UPI001FEB4153|nr:protein-glutamate O-methyltransferase [Oceanobacter mangrovi]